MQESAQQFGKYQILGKLGSGGFATVYRATDTTLGRDVALKILVPILVRVRSFAAAVREEARTLAGLRHTQIVTIHDMGSTSGRLYIVMDLVDGPSLAAALKEGGRIGWDETL